MAKLFGINQRDSIFLKNFIVLARRNFAINSAPRVSNILLFKSYRKWRNEYWLVKYLMNI